MGGEMSTDANAQEAAARMKAEHQHQEMKQQAQPISSQSTNQQATAASSTAANASQQQAPTKVVPTATTAGGIGGANNATLQRNHAISMTASPVRSKHEFGNENNENIISKSDMEAYFQSDFQVNIDPYIFGINKSIIQLRRYFHEIPELSFNEIKTAQSVSKYLKSRNLQVFENIAKTGVVGILRGGYGGGGGGDTDANNDGPCILLRADMDALPILETNDVSYKSKNVGNMHACGHDCHMAILLTVARILTTPEYRNQLYGTVKFCFQPGEEGLGGAKFMIEDGILEADEKNNIPRVDQVYGLHVWSYDRFGKCVVKHGPLMAGSDHFIIDITGKGGHGAEPKGTSDAIVAATQLILQFHTIISRNLSPLDEGVITIGKFDAGERGNIIAQTAKLEGTMRWFDKKVESLMRKRINDIIEGISKSFNVKINIEWGEVPYPATINRNIDCVKNVEKAVLSVLPEGVIRSDATMAAEDFSFFLNARPGCFFFLGCGVNDGTNNIYPHHKPDFKVDEKCLVAGVQIFVNLVLNLLKKPKENVNVKSSNNNGNNNNNNNNNKENENANVTQQNGTAPEPPTADK